jgi:dihydroorotate dehydrogenase (NAD+) catalytic subunit
MTSLRVRIGSLTLDNPVMPASGCFGVQLAPLLSLDRLGALVTKTVFAGVRGGNPAPRLTETPNGMINSVGIPSPGLPEFRRTVLPAYRSFGVPVIVSIGALEPDGYGKVAAKLADDELGAFEVNVSCPNLEHGGLEIGGDPALVRKVTEDVRAHAGGRPVIVKLTPNVASIAAIARAAEDGGADAVVIANTFVGRTIDLPGRPMSLGSPTGGVSGPAVKPLVLRLIGETAAAVGIPVIGCGGISTALDVGEAIIAGAIAVQVGTATFARPTAMTDILADLPPIWDAARRTAPAPIRDVHPLTERTTPCNS